MLREVPAAAFSSDFSGGTAGWTLFGAWQAPDGILHSPAAGSGNAVAGPDFKDFTLEGDVQVTALEHRAGLLFRATNVTGDGGALNGYFAAVRFSNDRTRLELWRFDKGPWVPLQSVMIYGVRVGTFIHLKVTAVGPNIWIYAKDMSRPALVEYDTAHSHGQIGAKHDGGPGLFDNLSATDAYGTPPPAPVVKDWSWVQGAIFYPSYALNSVDFWTAYDSTVVDRELSYARLYGLNTVCVYFNWLAWNADRPGFLRKVEDFLSRADKHALKVYPIFFDNVGNTDPMLQQLPPKPGVHNSRAMESPSWPYLIDYKADRDGIQGKLKAYVQEIVIAHKDDARILFWEVYNEPLRNNAEPVDGPAITDTLVHAGYDWIKATGSKLPVVSTAGDFLGGKYSDFFTYHSYVYDAAKPEAACDRAWGAEGGSEHLNTEGMDRPWMDMQCFVGYHRAHRTGFTFWEFLIARTQTRYPWSCNAGTPCVGADGIPIEPKAPFHGMVYADGHPWSLDDVKTLLNTQDLSALPVFDVTYWTGDFAAQKRTGKGQAEASSIAPRIDFDLPDEYGQGTPDPIAGVSANDRDDWSIRWSGKVLSTCAGTHTFTVVSDNVARVWVGAGKIIDKADHAHGTVSGAVDLAAGQAVDFKAEYVHARGPASMHVFWKGPCFERTPLPGRRASTPAGLAPGPGRTGARPGRARLGIRLRGFPVAREAREGKGSAYDVAGHALSRRAEGVYVSVPEGKALAGTSRRGPLEP
jgi:hypothetical protein